MSEDKKNSDLRIFSDYREYILAYLNEKKQTNAQYSMRAFARDLGLSPSTLSEALNRHHTLALKSSEKIRERLNLSVLEKAHFEKLVEAERNQMKEEHRELKIEKFFRINPLQKNELSAALDNVLKSSLAKYEAPDGELYVSVNFLLRYLNAPDELSKD